MKCEPTAGENLIFKNNILIDELENYAFEADVNKLDLWPLFVTKILSYRKWGKRAITDFLLWGDDGFNNPNLIIDTLITPQEFYGELYYYSDRMSLDSLFRCHILWQKISYTFRMKSKEKISNDIIKKIKSLNIKKLWFTINDYDDHQIINFSYHLPNDIVPVQKLLNDYFIKEE